MMCRKLTQKVPKAWMSIRHTRALSRASIREIGERKISTNPAQTEKVSTERPMAAD